MLGFAGLLLAGTTLAAPDGGLRFTDHPLSGRILDTSSGTLIDRSSLDDSLRRSRYVLIGEKHDNPVHHDIELALINRLVGDATRVVLEMLDRDQAEGSADLSPRDSPETLQGKLNWSARQWPWEDYGPLIIATLAQGGRLVAGNIPASLVRALYTGDNGLLDGDPGFTTLEVLGKAEKSVILDQLYLSHCETMPREALTPMLTIQTARDAAMAYALAGAVGSAPVAPSILVAGGFHVRRDLGVPRHLEVLEPGADTVVILLVEVDPGRTEPSQYPSADPARADFIWFTPATPATDYCADLGGTRSSG